VSSDTTKTLLRRLIEDGHTDISMADIQALLWYHEKDLFEALGLNLGKGASTDYEKAATTLFRSNKTNTVTGGVQSSSRTGNGGRHNAQLKSSAKASKKATKKVVPGGGS